ncbi:MAG TPA: thiamine pyrophosphate-binding protein [Candidatus Acidoferrales bacterium]|nr:thiamine pyrophosphate-binding protein [Candidatus Acidoferrales bacterium]
MKVAHAVVECLEKLGVKRAYGLIGTSILDLVDATKDSKIRYISTRHEQVAVSMADAEGRLTGNAGVAYIHGGPGFLNSLISIANAYKDSSPLFMISGAVKRRLAGLDSWLEVPQIDIIKPIVKTALRLDRPSQVGKLIGQAYSTAMSAPKGPVFVEVPEDVWGLEGANTQDAEANVKTAPEIGPSDIGRVAEFLSHSSKPLILVGGGLNHSEGARALIAFVEKFPIPVASTGNGRGVFPEDNALSLGRVGFGGGNTVADSALEQADLVIALGAGISDVTTYGYNVVPKGAIVAVDLDPMAASKPIPYAMHLYGDATSFLTQLTESQISCAAGDEWLRFIEERRESWNALLEGSTAWNPEGYVNASTFFKALDAKLPRDSVITAGQGIHVLYTYAFLKIRRYQSFLAATNLGAMGFAFPAALGAKMAQPAREVIAVLGDGEFLMTLQDLETAARENIGAKIIVVNDSSYRVLLMRQKMQKMGRIFGTLHSNPDMEKLASSFGIASMVLADSPHVEEAIEFILGRTEKPRILELKVSQEDMPPFNMEASLKF